MVLRLKTNSIIPFIIVVVASLHVVLCSNYIGTIALICIEVGMLLYFFLQNKVERYLAYYLGFISTSMEFTELSSGLNVYSLKEFRLFGINLGIWLLLPIWLLMVINVGGLSLARKRYGSFMAYNRRFVIMNVIAAFSGLLCFVLNDNNILEMDDYISAYFNSAYSFFFLPISIFGGFYVVLKLGESDFEEIRLALEGSLWACVAQQVISLILKIGGNYGGNIISVSCSLVAFISFLLLLSYYGTSKTRKINLVVGIIGCVLVFLYRASGKAFTSTLFSLLLLVLLYLGSKNGIKKIFGLVIIMAAFVVIPIIYSYIMKSGSNLLRYKLVETIQVFSFFSNGRESFLTMENSPRVRFGELIDVFTELIIKPWFIFFGKGYGGSIQDHSGFLYMIPSSQQDSAYSVAEFSNNSFYNLHEIAQIFLAFGLYGVAFGGRIIKDSIKSLRVNPWMMIGAYWFWMFYGFSFTISTYGIFALCYGVIKKNEE